MASLQKIRNHGGLLIAIVGLAMLAFILGDFLNSGSSFFHRQSDEVGSVAGNKINYRDFEVAKSQIDHMRDYMGVPAEATNDMTWNMFLTYYMFDEQAEKIGMDISEEELTALVQQYPIFSQLPGQYARGQYLQMKYTQLLGALLKTNTLEAEFDFTNRQKSVNVEYVMQPYSAIDDNLVNVSDADIEACYAKYYNDYLRQEPNRTVNYIIVEAKPSDADREKAHNDIAKWEEEFLATSAEDIDGFLYEKNEDSTYYKAKYYTLETVPEAFQAFAFGEEAQVGAYSSIIAVSPFAYGMARIMDINEEENSVQLAIVQNEIIVSDPTKNAQKEECEKFIQEHSNLQDFIAAAPQAGYVVLTAKLQAMDNQMGELQNCRDIVKWANGAEVGEVSDEVYGYNLDATLVMVALANIDNEKYDMAQIRVLAERDARNNAKAEYIIKNQLTNGMTVEAAAEKLGLDVQDQLMSWNGMEPALIGAVMAMGENQVSAPIQGINGVYLVKTGASIVAENEFDAEAEKARFARYNNSRLQSLGMYLYDESEVEDNRAKFY